jgi:endonuclease I
VWKAFASVDKHLEGYPCSSDLNQIPDIYSGFCWTPAKGLAKGGECGNYKDEGDCFNREHSWPKSWFGGFSAGHSAQTDLFELYPSDGKVNGLRGNLPFGYVKSGTETYVSSNNSKIGECLSDSSIGQCFEAADNLKGDLARTYFYLSVTYWKVWECCKGPGYDKWDLAPFMEKDLRNWHKYDPVSDVELKRNDDIFLNW